MLTPDPSPGKEQRPLTGLSQATFDELLEGCQIIGFDWRYLYLNKAVENQSRTPNSQLLGNSFLEKWPGIEKTELFLKIKACLEERKSTRMVNRFDFNNGTSGWFQLSIQPVPEGALIFSVDISDNVETQFQLTKMKRLYATLSQVNQALVRIRDRQAIFDTICRITIEFNQASLAWIGILAEDSGDVIPVAAKGIEIDRWPFEKINIHKENMVRSPAAQAILSSGVVTVNDLCEYSINPVLDEQLKQYDFHSAASVPIRENGKTIGIFSIIAPEPGFFQSKEEIALLEEMGLDISFALDILEAERVKNQWANAFEHCGHGIAIGDAEGTRIITCNRAFADMHGGTPAEICSRPVVDYYSPEDIPFIRERIQESLRTGSTEFEAKKHRLDGKWMDFHVKLVDVRDVEKRTVYRVISQSDITTRKRAEEELRFSQQTLALFIRYAPAAIAMFDCDMKYLAVSERFVIDYGIRGTSLLGRSHYDIFPEITENVKQIHRRCLAGAVERGEAEPFRRLDGAIDWVRWECHPWYDKQGAVGGIILFSENVTDKVLSEKAIRESEQKYRLLAESISDVIWILDLETSRFDYVSPSIEKLRGFTLDEVMAHTVQDALTPDSYRLFSEQVPIRLKDFNEGKDEPRTDEVEQPCKDGSTVWTECTTRFMLDPVTGKLKVYGISRDISERKRMEKTLRESEEKFRKAFITSPEAI
ncbi:MAG TPA: PAS domain S-box protein, partial [Bacteroidales bacterium]|nr:PAS domain S-box protein [Bacteroidales bacterium]